MKIICLLTFLLLSLVAQAQLMVPLTDAEKDKVIARITTLLDSNYVFPEKARLIGDHLREQRKAGHYNQISSYGNFAEVLNNELQKAHRDPHMRLHYNPELVGMVRKWTATTAPAEEMLKEQLRMAERTNFGFVKVERLPGNVGYIDFRQFFPVSASARQTVAAAIGFVANTEAVILDMRHNGGGHPDMVQLVMSYFFDAKPVHYNSIYNRPRDTTKDYHTLAEVEGRRMPETALYVLTSGATFSAAEELTYNLQSLKRATIVGETTAGGAHPLQPYVVNDHLVLDIPVARAINAVTKTNWEGTGVTPDVQVNASKALSKALELVYSKQLAANPAAQEKAVLEWELQNVQSELNPPQLEKKTLANYKGRYGERSISLEGDQLYYVPKGESPKKLLPVSETIFRIDGVGHLRVEVIRDTAGRANKLLELDRDGSFREFARTK